MPPTPGIDAETGFLCIGEELRIVQHGESAAQKASLAPLARRAAPWRENLLADDKGDGWFVQIATPRRPVWYKRAYY